MEITLKLLNEMPSGSRACSEARRWFEKTFPGGASLKEAWDACPELEWKIWFTCHYVDKDAQQKLAYKFAGQAFRFASMLNPELKRYADNVNEGNVAEAQQVAHAAYVADVADVGYVAYDAAYAAYAASATSAAYDASAAYDVDDAAGATYDAYDAAYATAYDVDDVDAAYAAKNEQARWCEEVLKIESN